MMDRFAQVVSSKRLPAFLSSFLFGWADSVEGDDGGDDGDDGDDDGNIMVMRSKR